MIRRAGIAVLGTLGLVLILVLAAFAAIQTGPGKRLVEARLGALLAPADGEARLEGLSGLVPFDMSLERLQLADAAGVWLEAERLRLAWSPTALLDGRFQVDDASIGQVTVVRLPAGGEDDDEPIRLDSLELPALPEWLPLPLVERLAVERLSLAAAVLGEAAEFGLHGRLAPVDRSLVLDLELERLDQATARLVATASLGLDSPVLELDVSGEETGGLLATLTGRPDAGDLDLRLAGRGPLDAWSGRLDVAAAGLGALRATLDLTLADPPRLDLDATLVPSDRLPSPVMSLLGDSVTLALGVAQTGAQRLTITGLRVETAAGGLTVEGMLDLDTDQVDGDVELRLPDLAMLVPMVDLPLAGAVTVGASVQGALDAPESRLEIAAERLALEDLTIATFAGTLNAAATAPLGGPDPAIQLTAYGRAAGGQLKGLPLPSQNLTFELAATVPLAGPAVIQRLHASTAQLELELDGRIDPETLEGRAQASLTASELGPLSAAFGPRIDGGARLDATLALSAGAEVLTVALDAALERLAGLPTPLGVLVGDAPELEARIITTRAEHIEIAGLQLEGDAVHAEGGFDLDLPTERVAAALELQLTDLAVLSEPLDLELSGTLDAAALIEGDLAAPGLDLTLTGDALTVAGRPIEGLSLQATSRGPPDALTGRMQLAAGTAGIEASLRTDYALRGDVLALDGVALEAPRSRAGGSLEVDLGSNLVTGRLDGEVSDLVGLRPLLPLPLRGAVTFDVELVADDGRQSVALDLDGSDLRSELGRLGRLALDARVDDALGTPSLDATLNLADLRQDEVRLERGTLRAAGGFAGVTLQASLDGEAVYPVVLEASGDLAIDDAVRLRLDRLDGTIDDVPLRLEQPVTVGLRGDQLRLEGLALRLAEARATADVTFDPRSVTANVGLAPLPLDLLARFGGPALDGSAEARLTLEGAPDDPVGALDLTITDLRVADPAFEELPPAQLEARARLTGQRLRLDVEGVGVTAQPLVAALEVPVAVNLNRGEFALAEQGALGGSLDAELELALLADLAGLHDDRLEGLLRIDLGLRGDVSAPDVQGSIEMVDALYENGTTGTVLRGLTLRARADGPRITIEELAANDGGEGRIDGSGVVSIDPDAGFPVDARAGMTRARLIRLDDLDATFTGDLTLDGDLSAATLQGMITVDRAEARIPDDLAPQVATLEVVEVGRGAPEPTDGDATAGLGVLELDLTIDLPGRVFVRGRGLESEWKGRLEVTGPATEPRLAGLLEIHRGYFDLLDRRFELRRGEIRFSGATPPNPSLDIQAVARTEQITALVNLTGEADRVEISLDSEPSLPEDEVLSQVMFGEESSDLSALQAVQLAAAVNRLRGGSGILDQLRSGLGIDTLDVSSDPTTNETTARVGKYVSDEVYVEVESGQADKSSRARVEVEILPGISVEADTGDDAKSGVGLRWRYDY